MNKLTNAVLLTGIALTIVQNALAMGAGRVDRVCQSPKHTEGRQQGLINPSLGYRMAECESVPTVVPVDDTQSAPDVIIVAMPQDTQDKPERQHCNNGEGNGSEGCSPSSNGNNDENNTTPREDHGKP